MATQQVCVFAFDLLLLDGEVLATQPFRCRRAKLKQLVETRADASRLRLACALEMTPEQTHTDDDVVLPLPSDSSPLLDGMRA